MSYNKDMRLYLASHGFGEHSERLTSMVTQPRVLVIDNAKDELPAVERAAHVAEKISEFETLGFQAEELDLRDYFKRPVELQARLNGIGLIWVCGGNTFVLRRAFSYSGFDQIVTAGLRDDLYVYGGSSAGSIIMTKTLRGAENGDDPFVVPAGYDEEIIWAGLGIIYPQLVVHYNSDWFKDEAQAMADSYDHRGLRYETLEDGQVYVVDGGIEEKL